MHDLHLAFMHESHLAVMHECHLAVMRESSQLNTCDILYVHYQVHITY